MSAPFCRVYHIDARHRLVISLIVAAGVWFATHSRAPLPTETIATWDAFAFSILTLAWWAILTTSQAQIRAQVKMQDVGRMWIFLFVVIAACAALFAVVFLFHTNKGV